MTVVFQNTHATLVTGALFLFACASPGKSALKTAPAAAHLTFQYDGNTGKCVNPATGAEGYNTMPPETLFANINESGTIYETTDAQCVDFTGFSFNDYTKPAAVTFNNWNLSGAKLTGASLYFIQLDNVNLSGADMRGFDFGYVEIHGIGDKFTQVGLCQMSPEFKINCRR
jgi:hypothetical protein